MAVEHRVWQFDVARSAKTFEGLTRGGRLSGNLANGINSMSSTNAKNAKYLPRGRSYVQNFITDPNFNFNPPSPKGC